MTTACPTCGHRPRRTAAKAKRPARRGISFGGRVFPEQAAWYEENMQVKRGELVWDMTVNADRFGARGGYVTPETAAENAARVASREAAPRSLVEIALDREQETGTFTLERRPRTLIGAAVLATTVAA